MNGIDAAQIAEQVSGLSPASQSDATIEFAAILAGQGDFLGSEFVPGLNHLIKLASVVRPACEMCDGFRPRRLLQTHHSRRTVNYRYIH